MRTKRLLSWVIALTMVSGSAMSISAGASGMYTGTAVSSAGALRWPEYEKLTPDSALKEFQERIAGWEECDYDDCIMLSENEFLTPNKPYHIGKSRYTTYRVTVAEGTTLSREDIYEKWLELLRAQGIPEKSLTDIENNLYLDEVISPDDEGHYNIISPVMNGYMGIDYVDVLSELDNVVLIEAKFSYNTHSRVNSTSGYCYHINTDKELSEADFPEGLGIKSVTKTDDMGGSYRVVLDSSDYKDYYEYAPYMLAIEPNGVQLGYATTCLADTSEEASISSDEWEPLYKKASKPSLPTILDPKIEMPVPSNDTLKEFQQRIASWEDADYEDCITLSDTDFLTPTKAYDISRLRMTSYRVFLTEGTTLDTDEVLSRWENVLRENGYPEEPFKYFKVEMTEAEDGGYYVKTTQEGYKDVSFLDTLKTFDNVEKIDAKFGYHTDSRPNYQGSYVLSFNWNGETRLSEKDFDDKYGIDTIEFRLDTPRAYELRLKSDKYSDYFGFTAFLLKLGAKDVDLSYGSTELADASDDAFILFPDWTVLYEQEPVALDPKIIKNTEYFPVPSNPALKEFQQRIASWEDADYEDCIMLSETEFLTPNKPYHLGKSRTTPYRVTVDEGTTLDREEIYEKWLELLRAQGIPEKSLTNIEHELYIDEEIAPDEDGYYNIISPVMYSYMGIDYIDVLSSFGNVKKIEAKFSYNTHSRVNSTGGYSFFVKSDKEINADDFDKSLNVRSVRKSEDMGGAYEIVLDSSDYKAYFEFAPVLFSMDIKEVMLGYFTTELADSREEAHISSPDWEVLYEREEKPDDSTAPEEEEPSSSKPDESSAPEIEESSSSEADESSVPEKEDPSSSEADSSSDTDHQISYEAEPQVATGDEDETDLPEHKSAEDSAPEDKSDKTTAPLKPGDANGDGVLDIEDAVAIINHINGVSVLDGDFAASADIDKNGKVDIEDIALLMNHINGIKPLF